MAKRKSTKKIETTVLKKTEDTTSSAVSVIVRPHITEKAAHLAERSTYVFEVVPSANKIEVKRAIQSLYGVLPVKVHMINDKSQGVVVRGKRGKTTGGKRAIVFLKKGQVIEFV